MVLFETASQIDYPLIDADAHVNEPPDTWQSRVPAKHRERAPWVDHTADGDVWVVDGGRTRLPFGLRTSAGRSYVEFRTTGARYDEVRPGNYDPKARLVDMEADGIYAQVLYPGVGLDGPTAISDDPGCQRACVRAYNEWIAEFTEGSEGRLVGQAIVPTTGTADAETELRWAIDHGLGGAILSAFPNGDFLAKDEDALFWGLANEARFPICVHIGSFFPPNPNRPRPPRGSLAFIGLATAMTAGAEALPVACDLMFSGIFEQYPDLRVVMVESGIGWIPTTLEQADNVYLRLRWVSDAVGKLRLMPSQIFHRNLYATFITDRAGLALHDRLNMDHIMWSTDYPHTATTWPNSWVNIETQFAGMALDVVKKVLHGNAKALYRLDHVPDRTTGPV